MYINYEILVLGFSSDFHRPPIPSSLTIFNVRPVAAHTHSSPFLPTLRSVTTVPLVIDCHPSRSAGILFWIFVLDFLFKNDS
ncbi:hypothetical protein Nepgr_002020 [Nepenthes gracilis]|uniref:Uncharacterized protein n=1 Tax=Nepenthes gracilis TaxID=150966 RepID=A0AAD3P647_NEPGR|nr:hypothetical protein Nepgr_002020 [Nepenthes gracilis]